MRGSRWRLGVAVLLTLAGVAAVAVTTASGEPAKKPPLIIGYAYD
jgi:hypothetical protein